MVLAGHRTGAISPSAGAVATVPAEIFPYEKLNVDARRQYRLAHQVVVDAPGGVAAFGDRPDDERLAAAHISRREYARDTRHLVAVRLHVAASVQLDAELFERVAFRAEKAHR